MASAYELALLGKPTAEHCTAVERAVVEILDEFGLKLRSDVTWTICPPSFVPSQVRAAAALFFGAPGASDNAVGTVPKGVPIVPVVSKPEQIHSELPIALRSLNAIAYDEVGPRRVAVALLECAGLLPRQRRVFISYRRNEARIAALQLFDELSARLYDVFVDTHGVPPGEDFQTILWHRLCDSDVLVMLDTPNYFDSRWTNLEFGRALAKQISVLQIGWPGVKASPRTATASRIELQPSEVSANDGTIAPSAIDRIAQQLELVRSKSIAVRRLNLLSKLAGAVQLVGGTLLGVGAGNGIHFLLPSGKSVVAYPAVGVPTSQTLHEASLVASSSDVVVIYDHVGINPHWLNHLDWLGSHITAPRWIRVTEAAWDLPDWIERS